LAATLWGERLYADRDSEGEFRIMSLGTVFLITAIIGGTVMACQFVLTLLGMDDGDAGVGHHDAGSIHDAGISHDGAMDHPNAWSDAGDAQLHPDTSWLFGVVSFRTLVAAAAFFGAAGRASIAAGVSEGRSLVVAVLAGLAAMYGMYWLMRGISHLQATGNERIGNAVGRRATVYVPVPADGQGAGKVQLSMQNRIVEFQAITDETEKLRTGETVEVVAVAGSDVLRVRRVPQAVEA
jgi:hypothetical protein